MSASTSTSTSALPTLGQALCQFPSSVCTAGPQPGTFRAQCAPLDLNLGPSQLSVHRWTSTWDLPSSVCTAGPQPGTFRAQCAPLDLNRGPSELSVHRWTSTWDLPSSVCTAGPQRPDRMPEDMPDRMSEDMPDRMPDRMPEDMPDRKSEDMIDKMPWDMPDRMPEDMSDRMPEAMPDRMPEGMPERMPDKMSDRMPEDMPDRMPEGMPERMPVKMSGRMPEDLPVLKRINVMVGITRSKVIEGKTVKRMCNGSESSSWPLQKVAIAYHPCQMLAATFAIHGLGTRLQKPLRIESFQHWPNSHKHWPCSALWTTSSSVVIDRSSHLPGTDATKAWVGIKPANIYSMYNTVQKIVAELKDIESTKECTWYGAFRICQSPKNYHAFAKKNTKQNYIGNLLGDHFPIPFILQNHSSCMTAEYFQCGTRFLEAEHFPALAAFCSPRGRKAQKIRSKSHSEQQ